MRNLAQWFSQYWMYALGLAGALIAFAVVLKMAAKAYKAYYKRYRDEEAEIKRLLSLKEKYGNLTVQTVQNAPAQELLEGVALSYQLKLQKSESMETEFDAMPEPQKMIYALDVFVSDKTVSTFFRENGAQLTDIIVPALVMIGMKEEAVTVDKIRRMFDEKDETVSFDQKLIENTEILFTEADVLTKIKLSSAKYIQENAESFV